MLAGCGARRNLIEEYNDFAIRAAKAGLWREAAFRWEKIVQINPKNAKAHNNLAVAYEALGRYDDAEREYRKALELDPANKAIQRNYIRFKRIRLREEGEENEKRD
ncbi:TPA: tetratricopeptide repeat protein [Candidatus Poribacteria bacterium]|nr:tetratricopeptide repeat protein [Candidatus Poribacteria bacterium]